MAGFIEKKKRFYEIYAQAFENIGELQLQQPYPGSESMWWLTSLVIDTNKVGQTIPEIWRKLKDQGVLTRRVFMPVIEFPPYFEAEKNKYTQAYRIYKNGLNLPSSTLNSDEAIELAADTLIKTLRAG